MSRPIRIALTLSLSFALASLAGCGGSSGSAAEPAPTDSTTTSSTTGGETAHVAFDDMTPEQKGQFMAEVVMPEMQRLFQEHDAEEYANFSCATCHGENAHEVGFRMPNGLAPLDPAHIPEIFQSQHPGAIFMTQRVWPRMAELLGEPLFNPETHEGFSCMNCHANAAATASAAH